MVAKNDKTPHEEILIEDLKDMDAMLQAFKHDAEGFKNKAKIIRSLLVISRDNLDDAIKRIDKLIKNSK